MITTNDQDPRPSSTDAAKAMRFLALKAAVFIGIPLLAALAAALSVLLR